MFFAVVVVVLPRRRLISRAAPFQPPPRYTVVSLGYGGAVIGGIMVPGQLNGS